MNLVISAFRLGGPGSLAVYTIGNSIVLQGRGDNGVAFNFNKDYASDDDQLNDLDIIKNKVIEYGLTFIL